MEKLTKLQRRAKKAMLDSWKSGVVARGVAAEFSGGLVQPGSLAVADCEGYGCERLSSEKKTLYLASDLADWIVRRFTEDHKKGKVA